MPYGPLVDSLSLIFISAVDLGHWGERRVVRMARHIDPRFPRETHVERDRGNLKILCPRSPSDSLFLLTAFTLPAYTRGCSDEAKIDMTTLATPRAELLASLEKHNATFTKLLSLIPARFYLPPDQEELDSRFMKNKKRRTGEEIKEHKRKAKAEKVGVGFAHVLELIENQC